METFWALVTFAFVVGAVSLPAVLVGLMWRA